MQHKWLNKRNNNKVIIFFNGWGMDESVVKHLNPENFDILMFYNYNELDIDLSIINDYKEKYLIAWSMGVMVATRFDIKYNSTTAINGTLKPIDDKFGIPSRIYDLTIKGFSPKGRERFIKSMFENTENLPNIRREFEEQKTELSALKNYAANEDFKYNRVLISNNDKIIPTKNQEAFWGIKANFESGHCPFYSFTKWSELL